jgi:hypothetical protein
MLFRKITLNIDLAGKTADIDDVFFHLPHLLKCLHTRYKISSVSIPSQGKAIPDYSFREPYPAKISAAKSTHFNEVMRFSRFQGRCVDLTRKSTQPATLSSHIYPYC